MSNNKKTATKRMGVKSVSAYGDRNLLITSFGKGNKANIEFKTATHGSNSQQKLPHRTQNGLVVRKIDNEIDLNRGELEALINNPAYNDHDLSDYLQLKGTLENAFFGKEFPHDTIRIQIIHNILDLLKILGYNMNDILYCIYNLQDDESENMQDFLGISLKKDDRLVEIIKAIQPYLGFFGDVFALPARRGGKTTKPQTGQRSSKQVSPDDINKDVLRILSSIRHRIIHHHNDNKGAIALLTKGLENLFSGGGIGSWENITKHYKRMVERVNKGFVANSGTNIFILFDILKPSNDEEKKQIVSEYYNFCIRKEGKNLGISMRKLRENLVDTYCPEIRDKRCDSFRSKLYTVMDYLLFRTMRDSDELQLMVDMLRETADEDEKDEIYRNSANDAWEKVRSKWEPFFRRFDEGFPEFQSELADNRWLKEVQLSAENTEPFVQLIAFLCAFLDGKEVNEMLSAYIHKFENIQSFLDVLTDLGEKVEFKVATLFNEQNVAGKIADQLRILASIGKMKPDLASVKRVFFTKAIQMLDAKEEYAKDDWLGKNLLLESTATKDEKNKVNPFRNFIINNVIKSRRFIYLVRYTKPTAVRQLMSNKSVVRYVLTRLPETQVDSYYKNIATSEDDVPQSEKIRCLTEKLCDFSFVKIESEREAIVKNSKQDTSQKIPKIERLKALTGLYLTVAFVAVKNLVKCNVRYTLAFWAYERDYQMFLKKDKEIKKLEIKIPNKSEPEKLRSITQYFLDKDEQIKYVPDPITGFDREACHEYFDSHPRHFKKKWREIFKNNIDEALKIQETGYLCKCVRNHAAHLNVLTTALPNYIAGFRNDGSEMTSYFELYHYLAQRLLCEETALKIPKDYREKYIDKGVPCLDLIHIAYVSLGYNLPRYKNLTTEALFDEDSVSGRARKARNAEKKGK